MDKRRVILNRLEILDVLGEGETATVYRARDHILKREVAVKEFTREWSRGEDSPIRREVKFLSQLDHPSLVKIFDLLVEEESGRSFLVEELVGGQDAGRFIGTASWEERWQVLIEILRGLEYLHQRGIIHLDIKPSNVLVVPRVGGFAVKILDFGLAEDIRRFQEKKVLSGTFPYIAPEVVRGDPVDGRADLYSLGMLFHVSIRETIEPGGSINQEVDATLKRKAPTSDNFPPGTPEVFAEILANLLRPDPHERFHSANHAIRRINKRLGSHHPLEPGRLRLPDKTTSILAGRRRETSLLRDRLEEYVRRGGGFSCTAILGDRDFGKTALLQDFKRYAQSRNHRVVDVSFPGDGVPELFDRTILPADEEDLMTHLPYLKSVLPLRFARAADPETLDAGPADQRARLKEKLAEALSIILAPRPLVLLIDDPAERPALSDLLSHYARHYLASAVSPMAAKPTLGRGSTAPPKVFLVLTGRSRGDLPAGMPIESVEQLRPWTTEQVREVVGDLLAVDAIPESFVRSIHEKTGGIPGAVVERLRLLTARAFRPGENIEAQMAALSPADLDAVESLPSTYEDAPADLGARERRILEWLSLSSTELTAEELRQLDPALGEGVVFTLRRLGELGWVHAGGRGFRVGNELKREAIVRALPADRRSSMGRRLAERMETTATGSVLQQAEAFFRCGDIRRGFAIVVPELRTALRLGQPDHVLRFLEGWFKAATDLPAVESRAYRRLLGETYLGVADFPKAISTLEPLAAEPGEPEEARAIRTLLVRAYRYGGHLDHAAQTIRSLGEAADPSLDALLADILLEQARYDEAAEIARPYLAGERPVSNEEVLAFRHVTAKVHFYRREHDQAVALFKRNCEETERTGRPARHALSLNSLAAALLYRGQAEEALPLLHSCAAISREIGDLRTLALAHANLAAAYLDKGQTQPAAQHYEKAIATLRKISDRATEARTLYNLGVLHMTTNDWAQAEDALDESVRLAREIEMPHLEARGCSQLAECHRRRGAVDQAVAEAERARALFEKVGSREDVLIARLKRIEAGLGHEPSEATAFELGRCEEASKGMAAPRIGAWCLYLRALLVGTPPSVADLPGRLSAQGTAPSVAGEKDPAQGREDLEAALRKLREHPQHDAELEKKILSRLQGAGAPGPTDARRVESQEGRAAAPPVTAAGVPSSGPEGLAWLEIAQRINSALDVQDVLTDIVDSLVSFAHAERGFLLLKEGSSLTVRVARTGRKEDLPTPIDGFSQTVVEDTIETGRPVITLDAMTDPRFKESQSVHQLQLRSVICVPLLLKGEALGGLYFDNRLQSARFGEGQLPVLMALSSLAAAALYKAELIARNARDQRELRRVMRDLKEAKERIEDLNKELQESNRNLQETVLHQGQELETARHRLEILISQDRPKYSYDRIVGSSPALKRLLLMIDRAVESSLPVLIRGESGTGKELVARAVHFNSIRKEAAFVPVNCAAVPHDLFESELFGHAKGAFTGADRDRPGLFEAAHGGTLFLDEIGDLPPPMQPKLLRAVQEGSIRRVGDSREIKVDVRLLAATNQDLGEMIRLKKFREDLYYRLCVLQLTAPPLRDRREDIPLIARHFLDELARKDGTPAGSPMAGRPPKTLSDGALRILTRYDWPGNVRELENVIQNAYALADGNEISIEDMRQSEGLFAGTPPVRRKGGQSLREAELELRKHLIREAIRESGGNMSAAARALKVDRNLLTRWARQYGLRTGSK